jgi:hypothetical protein
MNFIRKHLFESIKSISKSKIKTNYIFFDEIIKSGNFNIIGMRKIDFEPIVKTKFGRDGIGGVNSNLIKSRDLVKIYFKLKNNKFTF